MSHLAAVHKWLVEHPITLTVGVTLINFLLSMYLKEFRQLLHFWPRKAFHANDRILSGRRLQTLERLHNNTYGLVIWLAYGAVDILISSVIWYLVIAGGWLVFTKSPPPFLLWTLFFMSGAVGKAFQVRLVLKELIDYEKSVAEIKASMAYHEGAEKKLAAARTPSDQ